jgi:hypothetical protein
VPDRERRSTREHLLPIRGQLLEFDSILELAMNEPSYAARDRGRTGAGVSARRDSVRIDPTTGPGPLVTQRNLLGLQRLAGNRAVADRIGGCPSDGNGVLQRVALEDGPPLAPGNYRYGEVIVALKPAAMRATLTDMAAGNGLAAEQRWQQAFVTDMRAQGGKHSYEDPDVKQTVSVEPTLADRADEAQTQITSQVGAVQTQFQQSMLNSVRDLLSTSEKKLQA